MIQVALVHKTSYRFDRAVRVSPHVIRLRPAPHCRTPVLAYSLRVDPGDHFVNWQQDPFGNHLARFVFPEPTTHLEVTVDLIVAMTVINPFDFFVDEEARSFPFPYEHRLERDLAPYLQAPEGGPLFEEWVASAKAATAGRPSTIDLLVELNQSLRREIAYEVRMEPGVLAPEATLARRLGSCRDSAWFLVGVLRRLGLAARFVSGYLVQLAADVPALDGPAGPEADFTDLHAWAEVYVPGAGWIGLDPTSGLFAGEGHLPLACTPEPATAAPIEGTTEVCEVTFEYANSVQRLRQDPRVTLPYTDVQWEAVGALGKTVDAVLTGADVRLTMGGKPTFVSIDDMEAPEWNTTADGAHKRTLAKDLTRRLARRFAPGGLTHHGQGKWYAGEPLPRWQMAVYWRADGEPLWHDPALLADPDRPGDTSADDGHRLAVAVAARLGAATDLAVEVREGRLCAFLPPLRHLEDFVALVGALEAAVTDMGRPVLVEGYPPPTDPRLRRLAVTPGPGVIKVNVAPAASWDELTETVTVLYEEARQSRLGTEKFSLDGGHTGTGGGNHMTLGGPSAPDSPVLRRPDLLRSLVTYWQHHPSLSYLFSGRFIGPTGPAPRVDEARPDSLDELEIAFAEVDGRAPEPWVVDGLFRNLLVDVTGDTHRAEFCIDSLFKPDDERGRLGLVELRGFDMPPHPRMALVQALLVRALVARMWEEPYRAPLVRWGTELHDRFLLPHHVAADIAEVVDDLRRFGFDFDAAWLAPFLEFRFPRLGTVDVGGVQIELRAAIEPWPVLGGESGGEVTARLVDSSVERLQVAVAGLNPDRHLLTCNQVPVPLHPTGNPGAAVAGVRYRAWPPSWCPQRTTAVHAPLVFDLVDRWNGRSLGGCTYHVTHPGGRAYDRFPVNVNEAEARRTNRFAPHGHTPGRVDPAALAAGPGLVIPGRGAPHTLDLRRVRPA